MSRVWAEMGLVQRFQSPMHGTYRVTATLTGHDSSVFFVRTVAPAYAAWSPPGVPGQSAASRAVGDVSVIEALDGYQLMARVLADTIAAPRSGQLNSSFFFPVVPSLESTGVLMWEIEIGVDIWGSPPPPTRRI